jgi:nitric oxide reductase subunit B
VGDRLGWKGRQADSITFRPPGDVLLTPAQRACAYFFLVVGLLFLIQTTVGAASEHYRADVSSFFGFDLARWLPFNLVRTWQVQLSIFWTATSFLAAGIFLAPIISGAGAPPAGLARLWPARRPGPGRLRQHGRGVPRHPREASRDARFFRDAGLGVPRPRPGLAGAARRRAVPVGRHPVRGMRVRLRSDSRGNMPWMFFFTALAIPAFYAGGC